MPRSCPRLEQGPRGYLTKDAGAEEIQEAIEAVMTGRVLLDPQAQTRLLEAIAGGGDRSTKGADRPLPDGCIRREAEVLALIAEGRSNQAIARDLTFSPRRP